MIVEVKCRVQRPALACLRWVILVDFGIPTACPLMGCNLGHDHVAPHGPELIAIGAFVSWDQKFYEPIPLPKGKPLATLRDAAIYITKLPKAEHDSPEWQAAMEALLLVAEYNGPTMFARVGIMRALNRHVERVFDSSRKDHHWGRRKLARER